MGVASFDYKSETEGDLNFGAGDRILLHRWVGGQEWLSGAVQGSPGLVGMLPANFIRV